MSICGDCLDGNTPIDETCQESCNAGFQLNTETCTCICSDRTLIQCEEGFTVDLNCECIKDEIEVVECATVCEPNFVHDDMCNCICDIECSEGDYIENCECKNCNHKLTRTGSLGFTCRDYGSGQLELLTDTLEYTFGDIICKHKVIYDTGCNEDVIISIDCGACGVFEIQPNINLEGGNALCCNYEERFYCQVDDLNIRTCLSDGGFGTGKFSTLAECWTSSECDKCQDFTLTPCQSCTNTADGNVTLNDCNFPNECCNPLTTPPTCENIGSLTGGPGFQYWGVHEGTTMCNPTFPSTDGIDIDIDIEFPNINLKWRCTGDSGTGSSSDVCLPDSRGTYNSCQECYENSNCNCSQSDCCN